MEGVSETWVNNQVEELEEGEIMQSGNEVPVVPITGSVDGETIMDDTNPNSHAPIMACDASMDMALVASPNHGSPSKCKV